MTAQTPDKLVSKHPKVRARLWFASLGLFGVLRLPVYNQICIPYEFAIKPDLENRRKIYSTDLSRRYIATFRLQADGHLVLQSYSYPTNTREFDIQNVNEKLTGDFWIVLQRHFHDNWCRLIPFRDGCVVADRKQWEERTWDWSVMTSERLSEEIKSAYQLAYAENPHLALGENAR